MKKHFIFLSFIALALAALFWPKLVLAETCDVHESKTFECDPIKYNRSDKYFTDSNTPCNPGDCEKSCWWDGFTGINRECWPKGPTIVTPMICPEGYEYVAYFDQCCRSPVLHMQCNDPKPTGKYCPGGYEYNASRDICEMVAPPGPPEEFDPCNGDPKESQCRACVGKGEVWTALGCLPTDPADFVAWLLSAAIKIGGGIAFLLMLWGGIQIMTSTGNPEKLNQGKSIITSAVIGLLFIIFSVLLLKIIGIDIFQLPGFQK